MNLNIIKINPISICENIDMDICMRIKFMFTFIWTFISIHLYEQSYRNLYKSSYENSHEYSYKHSNMHSYDHLYEHLDWLDGHFKEYSYNYLDKHHKNVHIFIKLFISKVIKCSYG